MRLIYDHASRWKPLKRYTLHSCSHYLTMLMLRSRLGVTNQAPWFTSYLCDRTQRVAVNGGLSDTFPLAQGVPQGSCLGPLMFTVYTSELFDIVGRLLPSVHSYADDTQLYLAFSLKVQADDASAVKAMHDCIMDLGKWFGTKQQLAKVDVNGISIDESVVKTKPVVRNLGS